MLPEIDILGFQLQTFGLMLALALTSSGVLVAKRLKELGLPVDWVYEMMFCAGAGGIAGAKLWYVVEKGDLGSLLSGTGLVFYGGAIGGALAVMAYASTAASSTTGCSTWARPRLPSATRSGGSAASSRATATTASRRTCRGRWPIPTGRSRPPTRCTRPRSTSSSS